MDAVVICTFLLLQICIGCDYYYEGPIDLTPNYLVDNITIGEIIEISFELQLNDTCDSYWCHILRITDDTQNARLPMINIPASSHSIKAIYSENTNINAAIDNEHPDLLSTFNDAAYHSYYFKWSKTERIFIYDDIIYVNITNGSYDSSKYIDKQYGLWITDQSNVLDGNIANLCINSSWYSDTDSSQCIFYHKNPIKIVKDNQVGSIVMDDTVEISFDLQLTPSWNCSNGWCNILRVGSATDLTQRFPLVTIVPSNGIHYSVRYNSGQLGDNIDDLAVTSVINDGNYHRLYFKFTYTEKLFIFDYNYSYSFPGQLFDNYIGNNYAILVCGQNNWPVVAGLVKNLCLNTYKQTENPTINPTQFPTHLPTITPTFFPTTNPTQYPTYFPTINPTLYPTINPTFFPTTYDPTYLPTTQPTFNPTESSNSPTYYPTVTPTFDPTYNPTHLPTKDPTKPIGEVEEETTKTNIYNTNSNYDMNTNQSIFGVNKLIIYIFVGVIGLLLCIICCLYIIYLYCKRNNKRIERVKTLSTDENILKTNSIITPQSTDNRILIMQNTSLEMQQFSSNSQQQMLTPTDDGIDGNTKGNMSDVVTDAGAITNQGIDSSIQNNENDDDGDDDMYQPGDNVTAGM